MARDYIYIIHIGLKSLKGCNEEMLKKINYNRQFKEPEMEVQCNK